MRALLDGLLADRELRRSCGGRPARCRRGTARVRRGGAGPAPAAHHAYLGGLLEHTVAVATMALELCTMHPRLDRDML